MSENTLKAHIKSEISESGIETRAHKDKAGEKIYNLSAANDNKGKAYDNIINTIATNVHKSLKLSEVLENQISTAQKTSQG